MLPKALYGKRNWEQTLDPSIRAVSGGEVDTFRFFCVGIFGSPSLWAGAREALRESRFMAAIRQAALAYHRTFSRKLHYSFGGVEEGSADAISVICPLVSAALSPEEPLLEAAALDPASSAEAFRLALSAVFANWRQDPCVITARTRNVRIYSREKVPAILDGESVRVTGHSQIRFMPHCFDALVPASVHALFDGKS